MECQAIRVGLAGVEGDWDSVGSNLAKYFNMESYKVEVISVKDNDGVYLVQLNGGDIVKAMVKDRVATKKEDAGGKKKKLLAIVTPGVKIAKVRVVRMIMCHGKTV